MARRKLPHALFEYLDRGTEDELSLRDNRLALDRMRLVPRTLVDVSRRRLDVNVMGMQSALPVMIGPTGLGGLCAYRGEVLLAKAAAAAGVPYVVSAGSLTSIEDVMQEAGGALWFQMFLWSDRASCHSLIQRTAGAGYRVLVITVDLAVPGNREHNRRNHFAKPFRLTARNARDLIAHPRWMSDVLLRYALHGGGMPRHNNFPDGFRHRVTAPSPQTQTDCVTWDDLRAVRDSWPHALIVKGILTAEDAMLAASCGLDGVIVSNHGARNLDGAIAPIDALSDIVAAVGDRVTVMVDGGFRRGTDVAKAYALGARMVLLGRAPLYGLSAAGQRGVSRALAIFRDEIDRVLALLGCGQMSDLSPAMLSSADGLRGVQQSEWAGHS